MAYIQVEASVRTHRKFLTAGPAASWLWLCGLGYCQEGLTDGFIPAEALDYLGVPKASRLATRLVLAGLWDVCEGGGWQVHDYLRYNKSAAVVSVIKQTKREAGKAGGLASGEARREADASTTSLKQDAKHVSESAVAPREPISSRSVSTRIETSQQRPQPIISKRRLDAAFEGSRVYVPQRKHNDLVALRNHPGAETELFEWYERVSEEWATGKHAMSEPGANMLAFWDARYAEQWPATVTSPAASTRRPSWAPKVGA